MFVFLVTLTPFCSAYKNKCVHLYSWHMKCESIRSHFMIEKITKALGILYIFTHIFQF
jgi:hypothetical protein